MPAEQAPPRIPTELAEIADAVALCGKVQHRGVMTLNMLERERLTRYVGRMPESKRQAQRWKLYLRALRKEALAESDGEEAPPRAQSAPMTCCEADPRHEHHGPHPDRAPELPGPRGVYPSVEASQLAEEQRRRCRAPNPTPPTCSAGRCPGCGAVLAEDGDGRCPTVSP